VNDVASGMGRSSTLYRWFVSVKYLTYVLLSFNVYLFLEEELVSAAHSGVANFELASLIQLFSATLDTAAWVFLLLLFELETAVIPDDKLRGITKWSIHGVRLVCSAAIVSAFLGYVGEWGVFLHSDSLSVPACELVDNGWSVLVDFDAFTPLDSSNCAQLGPDTLHVTALSHVVSSPTAFESARDLALVDVLNAGTWILIVIALEVEVRLQLKGGLPRRLQWGLNASKVVFYLVLTAAAVYWGFEGEFLDFWDAALWLFAFFFIEMNVFEWQRELDHKAQ
jgi:hypothetical protein